MRKMALRLATMFCFANLICLGQTPPAAPQEGIPFVLDAFDYHSLVAVADYHGMQELHNFIQALIHSPQFSEKATEIVVEWGNSRYQDIADRYLVEGAPIPQEIVRQIWRNTTQSLPALPTGYPVWDSAVYQKFYETIRAVNHALPRTRRIRVILADSPIDWRMVRTKEDLSEWQSRRDDDFHHAMQGVFMRNHKALVLIGEGHLFRLSGQPGSFTQIEREHPGSTYLIVPHAGFSMQNDSFESLVSSWPLNSIAAVKGTTLGTLPAAVVNFNSFFGPGGPATDPFAGLLLQDVLDAYLYLGTRDSLHEWKPYAHIYRDRQYWYELNRRNEIVNGKSLDPEEPGWDNRVRLFDIPLGLPMSPHVN